LWNNSVCGPTLHWGSIPQSKPTPSCEKPLLYNANPFNDAIPRPMVPISPCEKSHPCDVIPSLCDIIPYCVPTVEVPFTVNTSVMNFENESMLCFVVRVWTNV